LIAPSLSLRMRLGIFAALIAVASASAAEKPRLILQITVDQLRGDLPTRYYDRLGEGGFRYLWESGIVYRDAHHEHANTETIVGHTTLATGAHPATHGMVGNLWFDRQTGLTTYNVEDPNYRLLTKGASVDANTEIDPTQRAARSEGRSPAAILVTTFGDELRSTSGGKAKVIGVSVKDRGAIAMAGHAGTAYWFSKASGEFVTSSYYLDRYPDWVNVFNEAGPAQRFANTQWQLLHDKDSYLFGSSDDRSWETDVGGFGRVFPHSFGDGTSPYFTTWLTLSPAGDEVVLDFAKKALVEEQLGGDEVTDFLSVSFSSTDYVGHVFGPSSLEAEDNILRLDRTLADLLAFVDAEVGLDNTLVVLSADHGGPDTPGYLNSLKIPAGYVDPDSWDKAAAIERIKARFGIEGQLVETYAHPYLKERMQQSIIGQEDGGRALIIGLLANGNLLVEGLPGLAKTRAIKALAKNLEADFSRIQFTPDLLPSDVTGTEVYYQKDGGGAFRFEPGPIFANIVLADEINRAPAKVQAAMLEAMEERQVTVAGRRTRCRRCSWSWRRRTPSSRRAPIRCRRRRWTAS
jgi:predicted AlkP superfamily pyrophosphatase or phosphodiesterase